MQEIVVSASAEPDTLQNIPANVQVITQREIVRTGASSISQLLERTTAVHVLVQPGNYNSVYLRGFNSGKSSSNTFADQILMLIDGNRAGTGNINNIPLAGVERVEIVRGPASMLYGGSAVGGVINIITKKGKGDVKGQVGAEVGSFDRYAITSGVSGGLANDTFGFAVSAQTESSGDYRDGKGHRYKNSSFNKSGGAATLSWRPHENTSISGVFSMQEVYDTGSPGDIYFSTPNSKTSNSWIYGSLALDTRLDNDVSIKASLYGNQRVYEDDNREAWPYFSRFTGNSLGARTIVGLPLPKLGTFDFGRLAVGAEYINHKQKLGGNSISEPDAETDVYSVFAEHKISPLESLTIQYGLRYDQYDSQTKTTNSLNVEGGTQQFSQVTWNIGATWWMTDWLGLRSSVGTAYVPPTSMQLVGKYSTNWGTTYFGNSDLEAEKSLTWDIGLDFEKYGLSGTVGYFHTHYKDRIVTETIADYGWGITDEKYINQGSQDISGLEATLRYTGTFALGNRTLTVAPYTNWEVLFERRNNGDDVKTRTITDMPRHTGLAGLGLGLNNIGFINSVWLDVNAQFIGDHYGYDFADYSYKNFSSVSLYNARLTVEPVKDLSLYLDVRNIGDEYYGYKPEFPMPGRSVTFGVNYEF